MQDRRLPTTAQLDYCRKLMDELGYDESELYERGIEYMSRSQLARLIDDLKDELEG